MFGRSKSVSLVDDMSWEDMDDDLLPSVAPYPLHREHGGFLQLCDRSLSR